MDGSQPSQANAGRSVQEGGLPADAALEVNGITAGYGDVDILEDVSLTVGNGSTVAVIGPNGAGKSTVLKTILGFLRPSAGSVTFNGRDITGLATHERVLLGMGYVPQGRIVFPEMTVLENLQMGAYTCTDPERIDQNLERCYSLFPVLADRTHASAGLLSGGQQQMLSVARAIMGDPTLVIVDEPSLGLAPKFIDVVFEVLGELARSGYGILMVEQNAAKALSLADYAYVLDTGRNRFEGRGSELANDAAVKRLYLGN